MNITDIKKVAIIGAGTMGQGIAQVVAAAGYEATLYDVQPKMLTAGLPAITANLDKGIARGKLTAADKAATLARIHTTNNFEDIKAELVIEAIVENLDIKVKVFQELEALLPETTVFASNTSSIPITQIAAKLQHPERMVGMHFFNPAHIMKLVEIISGVATDEATVSLTKAFVEDIGKKAVLAKDSPGFIVNRVARHFYVESLKLLEENVADVDTIDALLESSGFKMGPFKLMDLIGVDTNFAVTSSMFAAFHQDAKFRPSRIQQQKVAAGHLGKKSGRGFYNYE